MTWTVAFASPMFSSGSFSLSRSSRVMVGTYEFLALERVAGIALGEDKDGAEDEDATTGCCAGEGGTSGIGAEGLIRRMRSGTLSTKQNVKVVLTKVTMLIILFRRDTATGIPVVEEI